MNTEYLTVSPRRGGRRIARTLPPLVVLALGGALAWSAWPLLQPAREVAVVQAVHVRSAPLQPQSGTETTPTRAVQAPGWLEAEPFMIACTALIDGIVESVEVLEGDPVEKGQVVARLVAADSELRLRAAEAELAQARATLGRVQAEHDAAQQAWEHPIGLKRAAESGRARLAEAEAELARLPMRIASVQATLIELEEQRDRVQRSTAENAANDIELIIAQQRVEAQRSDLAALEASRPVLEAQIDQRQAELRAAERDLELRIEDRRRLDTSRADRAVAEANVARAETRRDEAALELERTVIRAPVSGYVQARHRVPGDKVVRMMDSAHSAHVVHLYDPSRLQVRVDVPLADAAQVSVGQACEVVVEVLPDVTFRGEVLRITHEADLQKNTLQVKVRVLDPDPKLRPEMLTRVKFLGGSGSAQSSAVADPGNDLVRLPSSALETAGDASRVWVVTERRRGRGVLEPRLVRVTAREGTWVTVRGAVRAGDLIATGVGDATPGERVQVHLNGKGDPS